MDCTSQIFKREVNCVLSHGDFSESLEASNALDRIIGFRFHLLSDRSFLSFDRFLSICDRISKLCDLWSVRSDRFSQNRESFATQKVRFIADLDR